MNIIEQIFGLTQGADPVQKRRMFGALNRLQDDQTPGAIMQRAMGGGDMSAPEQPAGLDLGGSQQQQAAAPPQSAPQAGSGYTVDRLGAFADGYSSGGLIGAIANATGGANRQEGAVNETFQFLVRKGLPEADARAVVQNPKLFATVLPALLGPKDRTEKLGAGEVLIDPTTGRKIYDNSEVGKPTSDITNYNFAKQQGYTGDFNSWKLEQSRAGATSINTDMRSENAEAKARGEGLGKRLNSIADDGVEARKDSIMFSRMLDLTKNVEPGMKTALMEEIRSMTGIALDPNANNVQAFAALQSYLAPRMRVPGSGASSDRDVSMFFRSLPSLMGTAEGNNVISETFGGLIRARQEAASIASQWQRGEITAADADRAIAAIKDPFEEFKRTTGAQKPNAQDLPVLSPQEAAKLPPGTRFKSQDGRVLQVPGAR